MKRVCHKCKGIWSMVQERPQPKHYLCPVCRKEPWYGTKPWLSTKPWNGGDEHRKKF